MSSASERNAGLKLALSRGKALAMVKAGHEPFAQSTPLVPDSDVTLGQLMVDEGICYMEAMEVMFLLRKEAGLPEVPAMSDAPDVSRKGKSKGATKSKCKAEPELVVDKAPSSRKRGKQAPSEVADSKKKKSEPKTKGSEKIGEGVFFDEAAGPDMMASLQAQWDEMRLKPGALAKPEFTAEAVENDSACPKALAELEKAVAVGGAWDHDFGPESGGSSGKKKAGKGKGAGEPCAEMPPPKKKASKEPSLALAKPPQPEPHKENPAQPVPPVPEPCVDDSTQCSGWSLGLY